MSVLARLAVILVLLAAPISGDSSATEEGPTAELLFGTAVNLETTLEVRQEGEPTIRLDARYDTRPLTSPLYYAVRLGLQDRAGAWELQIIHHKLHLSNPPEEIQHFEITHGFNILTVNRSFRFRGATLRLGAGVVVAHPESTVRDLGSNIEGILGSGYTLTGPAVLIGTGKAVEIADDFFVGAELQLTAARARVPVADGTADAPNVAVHVLFGAGYRF
jgi:hypothetical protein